MGRNETEKRIEDRLKGTDPRVTTGTYASKCRSAIFDSSSPTHPMLTVAAFLRAAQLRPHARDYWLSRLESIDADFVRRALGRIPGERIPAAYRTFAYEVITFNRGRLLAARTGLHNA